MSTLTTTFINHADPLRKRSMSANEDAALNEALSLYNPYGILRSFTTYYRPGNGLGMYVGHGQYADFDEVLRRVLGLSGLDTGFGNQVYGGGKGHDLFGMVASSVGEAVERVTGSFAYLSWMDRIERGSWRDLTDRGLTALHPSDVHIMAPEQFADPEFLFDPWEETTPLGWIPGTRLLSGETVYVPAQLAMLFYFKTADEPTIGLAPSGGLASHINEREALYHGILELIERDAVNLRWYTGTPLDQIVIDRPVENRQLRRLLDDIEVSPSDVRFYYHNLDYQRFPVITALGFDNWYSRFGYYAGGGVGSDTESTMVSALTELSQAERSLRICLSAPEWEFAGAFAEMFDIDPTATPEEFTNFIQVIPYYGYPENQQSADWYFNGGEQIPLSELPSIPDQGEASRWDDLVDELTRRGLDPITFDFTPEGLGTMRLMKVFMPELAAPYPPSSPGLGHPRYYDLLQQVGRTNRQLEWKDLNHDPLPYP